jgi:hypothetical protein
MKQRHYVYCYAYVLTFPLISDVFALVAGYLCSRMLQNGAASASSARALEIRLHIPYTEVQ